MVDVKISTEIIKLDAFLKWCGAVMNGGEAKLVVQDGRVKVNGEIETQRGKKLRNGDTVEYNQMSYRVVQE